MKRIEEIQVTLDVFYTIQCEKDHGSETVVCEKQ